MRVFRSPAEVPADFGPSAVTVGKFDGVHTGHRAVIAELERVAAARGLASAVVTFDRNPLEVLAPDKCPESLVSVPQKLDLLAESGLDATLMLTFDRALSRRTAEEFVKDILVDGLGAVTVMVGSDFRFGAGGSGNVVVLRDLGEKYGFEVDLIDDVRPPGGERVSSTGIRRLLAAGDVAQAARLLGHLHFVRGIVVHGAKRGRELGFPTANLSAELEGLIPADGVYAGWLEVGDQRYPAAISVGNNPTFEGVPQRQVEAYVIDRDLDLYDRVVAVSFVDHIRGMVAFTGVDALIDQIGADVERARRILA
ncbi:bifunctional riboflavin kinase/FAD synthetase [Rathayibacter soli]|uniref:bifunctional riboflavin kinase/FAD synthetase n=1 Tax=Rathayibacter soli TaxID=3144168 RepID=UPI0027E57D1D|nr:bifunctional riboflavin kinase/FAD synthetase [Glaciibacter superstes]